jgi:integral membrane sensor domain MASE1
MENVKSEVVIKNENLFRALACAPIAILFVIFAVNSVTSPGILLFKVLFVLLALYFTLTTLAYAAYYTNDHYEGNVDNIFENENLFKTLCSAPIAILFVLFAVISVTSSGSMLFTVILVLLALYFILKTLAYAAYYTNDCYT